MVSIVTDAPPTTKPPDATIRVCDLERMIADARWLYRYTTELGLTNEVAGNLLSALLKVQRDAATPTGGQK